MRTFKEYWLDDLKARVGRKTIYSKEYEHAAKALFDLVHGKNLKKKGLTRYAWELAKQYAHIDYKELEAYFRQKYNITESQDDRCEIINFSHLKRLEREFDEKFANFDLDFRFTRHFADRLSDSRNRPCITPEELENVFNRVYFSKKMGRKIFSRWKDLEFVLKDLSSDINIPFVVEYDENQNKFVVIAKTIMRKKDFKSSNNPIVKL